MLTDSTAKLKADETKGVCTDSSTLSPNATTGSAKGTVNTPTANDCGKSPPQGVTGDLSSSPLTQSRFVKHHPPGHHQTRRHRFNIITGHPLQLDRDPPPKLETSFSFTSPLNKINTGDVNSTKGTTGVGIEANTMTASAEQLQKAPHLDMRRNRFHKNASFSGLSTYRASFKPTPGFYSSTMGSTTSAVVPSATNPCDSSSALMNYSRHSATVFQNLKTSKGAPLNSGFVVSTGSDSSLLG